MIDGVGSADLMVASMSASPHADTPPPAKRWRARPGPAPFDLLAAELRRGVDGGLAALRAAPRAATHPIDTARVVRDALQGGLRLGRIGRRLTRNRRDIETPERLVRNAG